MRAEPGARDGGFTLIEVLVVLVILAVSAGLVLGRGPARSPTLDARAAAGQLMGGLRQARAQAIARDRVVLFAVDVGAGRFRIGDGPVQTLPGGLALRMVAVADQGTQAVGGISFLPDGSSTGGRIGLGGGTVRVWIGVDWLTGRVSLADAG